MSSISNTTNLNVRVDKTLKEESDILFKELGINMSTAINMFLTKCVRTSSIPFKIEKPKYHRRLKKAMKEVDKMLKHPEKVKGYHNVDEMFKDIIGDTSK